MAPPRKDGKVRYKINGKWILREPMTENELKAHRCKQHKNWREKNKKHISQYITEYAKKQRKLPGYDHEAYLQYHRDYRKKQKEKRLEVERKLKELQEKNENS